MNLQITIFLLVAVGFIIKRLKIIGSEGQKNLNDLVIYIILPCNIVKAFMVQYEESMAKEFLMVLTLSIGIQILFVVYGKIMFRKQEEGKRKCLQYGTICSNAGFLGNPVAEGVFGTYGLILASIFLIPMRIMMWSEGLATFSGSKNTKSTIKKVCTHPCIIACVIGIIIMVTGITLPDFITKTITYLGNCNTALSMCIIGMILEAIQLKELFDRTVLVYSFHRLILLPIIILTFVYYLPISSVVKGIVVLLSAMPAGATTSILASKYDMEPQFATKMVITSTLLSIPTICIWSIILTTMI